MFRNVLFSLFVFVLASCGDEEFEIENDVYYSECLVDEVSGTSENTELTIENSSFRFTGFEYSNQSCLGVGTITIPAETLTFKYTDKDLGKDISYLELRDTTDNLFYQAYKTTDTRVYLSERLSEADVSGSDDFEKIFFTFIQNYHKYAAAIYFRNRDENETP